LKVKINQIDQSLFFYLFGEYEINLTDAESKLLRLTNATEQDRHVAAIEWQEQPKRIL
jgi:hypothetical protein